MNLMSAQKMACDVLAYLLKQMSHIFLPRGLPQRQYRKVSMAKKALVLQSCLTTH